MILPNSDRDVLEKFDRMKEEMELRGLKVTMEKIKIMVI